MSLSPTRLLPRPLPTPLHTATASPPPKGNHAPLSPATQARLNPDTFFADGSRIRLIEPMTPEREAALAWCNVAGAWRGLVGLGALRGTSGRRWLQSCSQCASVSQASAPPAHSQLPFATQAGLEEEVRRNRRLRPARSTGANPSGRPPLCAPSAHASGVACLSGDPSAQARTRREAFAAGVASGTRCDSTASLCLQSQPAFKVKNVCAQSLGTRIRYAGDDAEDGPHTIGVSAHREQT